MAISLFEFVFIALTLELTPGPNMTWLALLSARRGRLAGLGAVAGVTLGLSLLATIATLGVATVLAAYPIVTDIIRWAGVVFLFFLAVETWFGLDRNPEASTDIRYGFFRGFLVNLLNPKAAAVFLILIPNAIGADTGSLAMIGLLSAVYISVATAVHLSIVLLASLAVPFLQDPQREQQMRWASGGLLVACAVWFAISTGSGATAG